jgi:diaminopimelate decarboxylase
VSDPGQEHDAASSRAHHFEYRDDRLWCEDVPLAEIARRVGTPTYVYSQATLSHRYRLFDQALAGTDHLICYAVKANSNLAVLRLLFSLGAGADIVSGGELVRCLRAGCDPGKIVFSGVGKTADEMRQALAAGILAFNVESAAELELLAHIAADTGVRAPVSIRVNPDVDAQTHPYVATGLEQNKFGIPASQAPEVYARAAELPGLRIVGVDCHIGSQLTGTGPFSEAISLLANLVHELADQGIELEHIDIGGGLGIPYGDADETEPPSPASYAAAIRGALGALTESLKLICEPGRVIAATAGVLLTEVLYNKSNVAREFVVVDAALNDLTRPALYGSYHPLHPEHRRRDRPTTTVDVVGPICETGDFLARDREVPGLEAGELLAIGAAGAYGFSMASNYNTRPRAAEVLVRGDRYAVVRERETVEQLLENESVPEWL